MFGTLLHDTTPKALRAVRLHVHQLQCGSLWPMNHLGHRYSCFPVADVHGA